MSGSSRVRVASARKIQIEVGGGGVRQAARPPRARDAEHRRLPADRLAEHREARDPRLAAHPVGDVPADAEDPDGSVAEHVRTLGDEEAAAPHGLLEVARDAVPPDDVVVAPQRRQLLGREHLGVGAPHVVGGHASAHDPRGAVVHEPEPTVGDPSGRSDPASDG